MRLSKIAEAIGIKYEGDDLEISGIHTLDDASSSQMSFLDNAKYLSSLESTQAAVVLCNMAAADKVPSQGKRAAPP